MNTSRTTPKRVEKGKRQAVADKVAPTNSKMANVATLDILEHAFMGPQGQREGILNKERAGESAVRVKCPAKAELAKRNQALNLELRTLGDGIRLALDSACRVVDPLRVKTHLADIIVSRRKYKYQRPRGAGFITEEIDIKTASCLEKIELGIPPYLMRYLGHLISDREAKVLEFLRRRGRDDEAARTAARKIAERAGWKLLLRFFRAIIRTVERRTGRKFEGGFVHFNSKKPHLVPFFSSIDKEGNMTTKKNKKTGRPAKIGRQDAWVSGIMAELDCGYKLPPLTADRWASNKATGLRRYPRFKGMGVDTHMSRKLVSLFGRHARRHGRDEWMEESKASVKQHLESVADLKAEIEKFDNALAQEELLARLGSAAAAGAHNSAKGQKALLQAELRQVLDHEEMVTLAKEFPLAQITAKIVGRLTSITELVQQVIQGGLAMLLTFLRNLFATTDGKSQPMEDFPDIDREAELQAARDDERRKVLSEIEARSKLGIEVQRLENKKPHSGVEGSPLLTLQAAFDCLAADKKNESLSRLLHEALSAGELREPMVVSAIMGSHDPAGDLNTLLNGVLRKREIIAAGAQERSSETAAEVPEVLNRISPKSTGQMPEKRHLGSLSPKQKDEEPEEISWEEALNLTGGSNGEGDITDITAAQPADAMEVSEKLEHAATPPPPPSPSTEQMALEMRIQDSLVNVSDQLLNADYDYRYEIATMLADDHITLETFKAAALEYKETDVLEALRLFCRVDKEMGTRVEITSPDRQEITKLLFNRRISFHDIERDIGKGGGTGLLAALTARTKIKARSTERDMTGP
jgi:hypothetical protein